MVPNLSLSTTTRWGVSILLLLAGVVALRLAQSVIIPLLIALMLAAVLAPAAGWLNQVLKIRWSLACLTVIFGVLMFGLLLTLIFGVAVSRLASGVLPGTSYDEGIRDAYRKLVAQADRVSPWPIDQPLDPPDPSDLRKLENEDRVVQYLHSVGPGMIGDVARSASNGLLQGIVIMFILLFLLLEGRMLARRVVAIFGPSQEVQSKAREVLTAIANQVRTYLVNRTLLNLALALVMGTVYWAFGLREWVTWAVLLAVLNYIPYLGPVIAGLPPFVDAFVTGGPMAAIVVTLIYAVAVTIEGYFAFPVLLGRSMDLNATTVMLACLFWDLVWGTTGLFLVMPIMAGIKAMLYHIPDGRAWADLMSTSDEPAQPVVLSPPGRSNNDGVAEPASAVKEYSSDAS
jgi:predicted PurR-regulated permease PerM